MKNPWKNRWSHEFFNEIFCKKKIGKKNNFVVVLCSLFVYFYFYSHRIFVSPADVEPPELDSLLEAIETGLGLRDDAPELGSDTMNWHWFDKRCSGVCCWFDWFVVLIDVEQLGCVACTLSVSQLTIILYDLDERKRNYK